MQKDSNPAAIITKTGPRNSPHTKGSVLSKVWTNQVFKKGVGSGEESRNYNKASQMLTESWVKLSWWPLDMVQAIWRVKCVPLGACVDLNEKTQTADVQIGAKSQLSLTMCGYQAV